MKRMRPAIAGRRLVRRAASCAALASLAACVGTAVGQDGSLALRPAETQYDLTLENGSFIYRERPPEEKLKELSERDIITVIVDYRTRMLSEGDAENRNVRNLIATLVDWVKFDGKSLKPAPQEDGNPRIAGTLNSQSRAESDMELRDSLSFRIAATIVDIHPNGNLVIEANWDITNNEERWRISLSGEVRRESISADRTVSSDAIADLKIVKREIGQVRDGYARGWAQKWYDRLKPF